MNGKPTLAETVQALEVAISAVPLAEIPGLLGHLERLKAVSLLRMIEAPQHEHAVGELLTVPQAAKRLKISTYRTYEMCRNGELKAIRVGKPDKKRQSVRVRPEDLVAYIDRNGD